MVILDDDELLRTSTGCITPAFSLTLYIVSLNITVILLADVAMIIINTQLMPACVSIIIMYVTNISMAAWAYDHTHTYMIINILKE